LKIHATVFFVVVVVVFCFLFFSFFWSWGPNPGPLVEQPVLLNAEPSHQPLIRVLKLCHGLNMLGPRTGTIWRCGFVGVGVSLWAWALRTLILAAWKSIFC